MKTKFVRDVMLQLAPLYVSVNPSLWQMMNEEFNELERLAEIGRATEKAFEDGKYITDASCKTLANIDDLLDWAKEGV